MKNLQLQQQHTLLIVVLALFCVGAICLALFLPKLEESTSTLTGRAPIAIDLEKLDNLDTKFSSTVAVTKPTEDQPVFISRMIGYFLSTGKIEPVDKNKELPGIGITALWLIKYDLPIDDTSVRDADPDTDGFSNLEEYQGDTDPKDKSKHPPIIAKLRVKKFNSIPFNLEFRGLTQGAEGRYSYQLAFKGKSKLLKEGEEIEGYKIGKYQNIIVEKFNDKTNTTEKIDLSELEVTFIKLNETIKLVLRTPQESDESTVELVLSVPGGKVEPSLVKKGDPFSVQGSSYQLVKSSSKGAVIRPVDEKDPAKTINVPMLDSKPVVLSP